MTLRPSDLRIELPEGGLQAAALGVAGVRGCGSDEATEQMARRCLRFSNGIANVGEGPLEVRLSSQAAATSATGAGGFTQVVHRSDGSTREAAAGPAAFHATHRHFHYARLATYELFAYDLDDGRGDRVAEGRKAGFCFYDTAMVDLLRPGPPQAYDGAGCFDPSAALDGNAFTTGVSPGFTDFYGWYLPDQYIEVSGLPDGVYELVTVADGGHSLLESDVTDNAGTAVFRLDGDRVTVLWTTGA